MKTLGFDPGGSSSGFGCAYLDSDMSTIRVATVSSVDEAMRWVDGLGEEPSAAGIDTLLFWQSTRSGWRGADEFLRRTYPRHRNSVVSSNGLYGSMAVQGAVLASRLRDRWPTLNLTETHPKMLWAHLFAAIPYPRNWLGGTPSEVAGWLREIGLLSATVADDHQFDAVMSAWAAFQAYSSHWSTDLANIVAKDQIGPNVSVVANINYYWPN